MSLNIANCPRCGKIYAKGIRDVCVSCAKEIELEYEKCVEFLRENRGATIFEVSDATEVSVRQITKFIREGRISLMNAPNLGYPCESCGIVIRQGNLCDDCRNKFTRQAKRLQEELMARSESEKERISREAAYKIKSNNEKS